MRNIKRALVAAMTATIFASGLSAATLTSPIANCAWNRREFKNLGNGDYTLQFAPLAESDDRSAGGFLGYLTIEHRQRGRIYAFDLFQSNGYSAINLIARIDAADTAHAKKAKPKPKKQNGQDEASSSFELYEFDESLRMAEGGSTKYVFIPRLGQLDYYKDHRTEGTTPISPRDPKFRMNDNLWKFFGCR
jgi:hypothetical protein